MNTAPKAQAPDQPTKAAVLNSWKEIATYVGRGVRTVQRWERELGMPVHRPRSKDRTAVLAVPQEIDIWLRRPSTTHATLPTVSMNGAVLRERAQKLRAQTRVRKDDLRREMESLERTVKRISASAKAAPDSR